MSNYYGSHYRGRRSQPVFQAVHAATGAAILFSFGILAGVRASRPEVSAEVIPQDTPAVSTPLPENVKPAVVIPNYRNVMSYEVREALDRYLDQDDSRYCNDFNANGITLTDHLRLRKGPGTEYDIITELDEFVSLQVLGECDNDWYLVSTGSQTGFVSGDYLRVLTSEYLSSHAIQPSTHFLKAVTAISGVNVRDNPNSENSEIIGGLIEGQTAPAYEKLSNGWYHIHYGDREGYVSGDFVKEVYVTSLEELPLIYVREQAPYSMNAYDSKAGTVRENQFFRIYGENEDYYIIQYNGSYVYILKDCCERMSDYYAIVDISDQTLRVYHYENEILSTRVVTGKDSTPTDLGYFMIYNKEQDTIMSGEDYCVKVPLALYYNGWEAIHTMDRGEWDYTHDVHNTYGSHGCVNTPPAAMEKVYSLLNRGDRVFVKE